MPKLLSLVLPLCVDTFVVASALGVLGLAPKSQLRVSLQLSAWEALTPLVGLALGAPLAGAIGTTATYVAIGVLLTFGLYTLLFRGQSEERGLAELAHARGPTVLLLGASVAVDEFAIGFALGLLGTPAVLVIALIALQAFAVAQLGLRLGARLSTPLREAAERIAGLMLTGLAVALLLEQLLAASP